MKNKSIFLLLNICLLHQLLMNAGCPVVCPSSNVPTSQLWSVNVKDTVNTSQLCVTGNAQIGGSLTVCGPVTFPSAYGFFYDSNFSFNLDPSLPSKIPFTNVDLALNLLHPNATEIGIQLPGAYSITVMLEPNTALDVTADYEIQKNGITIPGSVFSIGAGISGIEISTQALVVAIPGDVITVVTTATGEDITLTGISSLIVDKIA